MEEIPEFFIESPHASESRRERHLSHGHPGFVDELLGKKNAPSLRNGNR
jgi:hypothetical protein